MRTWFRGAAGEHGGIDARRAGHHTPRCDWLLAEAVAALASEESGERAAARHWLKGALPTLTLDDLMDLTPLERDLLWLQLDDDSHVHADFQVALIEAAARIGDARALPYVSALADPGPEPPLTEHECSRLDGRVHAVVEARRVRHEHEVAYDSARQRWPDAGYQALLPLLRAREDARDAYAVIARNAARRLGEPVHAAARAQLPELRERAERLRRSAHLLRPADPVGTSTLLRPAAPGADTPPDRLLRPSGPDCEDEVGPGSPPTV